MLDLLPPELQPLDESMYSCDIKSQALYSGGRAIQAFSACCRQVKEYLQNYTIVWMLRYVIDLQS